MTILQIAKEIMALIPAPRADRASAHAAGRSARSLSGHHACQAILGWTPVVPRKEGLKKMIDFYRDRLVLRERAGVRALQTQNRSEPPRHF
jgi:nucleoside-diphosphate-sugar epimerase